MAAHLFGYVGEVTEAQLTRADYDGIEPGPIVGQAGVEQAYNRLLMGVDGNKDVIVNSLGREIGKPLQRGGAGEGQPLQLTIDADVQKAAEDGFALRRARDGYNGAAVVLDPRNGEVLSLVSLPAYDPEQVRGRHRPRDLDVARQRQAEAAAEPRAAGPYSPGSTFKIVVGDGGARRGRRHARLPRASAPGGASFYGRYFQCHLKGGHGSVDMRHAIEQSCNVYFYTLGNMLGVDRIHKWATLLGLGEKNGIDLPNEVQGLVPSTEWKRADHEGEVVRRRDDLGLDRPGPGHRDPAVAGGDDDDARQRRHARNAARRSRRWTTGKGWKPVPAPPPQSVTPMKPSTVEAMHDGLWLVVNGAGTGGRARIAGTDVSGKTGTAQVISLDRRQARAARSDLRDHGWFVFFAPRDNPEIAGVVFAEHAEHGSYAALDRQAHHRDLFREEGRAAAAGCCRRRAAPATDRRSGQAGRRCRRAAGEAQAVRRMFERRLYLPHRLAAAGRDPAARRHRRRDDLQHDLRPAARRPRPRRAARSGPRSTRSASA